jgi:hypothetical protein
MSFVPLRPEILQRILEQKQNDCESQQWIGEVSLIDEGTRKPRPRYVLMTETTIYMFPRDMFRSTKASKLTCYPLIESMLDLCEATVEHDECTLRFKQNTYHFITPESGALVTNALTQLRRLMWNVNAAQVGLVSPIWQKSYYLAIPPPRSRPPDILIHRYIARSVSKQVPVEATVMAVFSHFSAEPRKRIVFRDCQLKNPTTAVFALSLEAGLRCITLDNCSPENLGHLLSAITVAYNRFTIVDFRNYKEAQFKGVAGKRGANSHTDVVRFHSCSRAFICSFLSGVRAANYSFATIIFDGIQFETQSAHHLVTALQQTSCFGALVSLGFITCTCFTPPFQEFALQCLKARETLTSLHIEKCDVDIGEVLVEIARLEEVKLQNVVLRRNQSRHVISHDHTVISPSVVSLNLGESQWTTNALISFLGELCRSRRRTPLSVWLDLSRVDTSWGELFAGLPLESMEAVITELNFSKNVLDAKSFEAFARFLATQSPSLSTYSNRLTHLNISHCFGFDATACVSRMLSFFEGREIWGLEICGVQPVLGLNDIRGLHSLNIGDNVFDDRASRILMYLVLRSPTLTELGVSNVELADVSAVMAFYTELLHAPRILAFERPTGMLRRYHTYSETKDIKDLLKNKRNLSCTTERLQLFLSLSGDFATRVAKPPVVTEESDDDDKPASPLFETTFSNPIPSLFTLATLTGMDVEVNPVASMVAEYVATSGKYGIVPPTAPPPNAPTTQMATPAVCATMQTAQELANTFEGPFDLNDPAVEQWSVEIAGMMIKAQGPLNVKGTPELWSDPKALLVFDPVDFGTV